VQKKTFFFKYIEISFSRSTKKKAIELLWVVIQVDAFLVRKTLVLCHVLENPMQVHGCATFHGQITLEYILFLDKRDERSITQTSSKKKEVHTIKWTIVWFNFLLS